MHLLIHASGGVGQDPIHHWPAQRRADGTGLPGAHSRRRHLVHMPEPHIYTGRCDIFDVAAADNKAAIGLTKIYASNNAPMGVVAGHYRTKSFCAGVCPDGGDGPRPRAARRWAVSSPTRVAPRHRVVQPVKAEPYFAPCASALPPPFWRSESPATPFRTSMAMGQYGADCLRARQGRVLPPPRRRQCDRRPSGRRFPLLKSSWAFLLRTCLVAWRACNRSPRRAGSRRQWHLKQSRMCSSVDGSALQERAALNGAALMVLTGAAVGSQPALDAGGPIRRSSARSSPASAQARAPERLGRGKRLVRTL